MSEFETEHEQDDQGQGNTDRNWQQARSKISKLEQRVQTLQAEAVKGAVSGAGFDPKDGVTKLVIEKFEASLGDEDVPSPEAFKTFAEQLGIKPQGEVGPTATEDTSVEDDMQTLQNRAEKLEQVADSDVQVPDELATRIQEAEQAGDARTSASLKLLQYRQATGDVD